jgi:hypothetical protein
MLQLVVSLVFVVVFNNVCLVAGWDPSNFTFNPGDSYELVWQDEFKNVGPSKAIIIGQSVYSPNPQNWAHILGTHCDAGLENYTDSIQNSYVQNGQLTIVAMKEGYQSAMLTTADLHEFTFGVFAPKIRPPYVVNFYQHCRFELLILRFKRSNEGTSITIFCFCS